MCNLIHVFTSSVPIFPCITSGSHRWCKDVTTMYKLTLPLRLQHVWIHYDVNLSIAHFLRQRCCSVIRHASSCSCTINDMQNRLNCNWIVAHLDDKKEAQHANALRYNMLGGYLSHKLTYNAKNSRLKTHLLLRKMPFYFNIWYKSKSSVNVRVWNIKDF